MNVTVTGASSGIGRALAAAFARNGHAVLATARREGRLQALRQEAAEHFHTELHILPLDLTAPGAPQALFDEAVRVFGKVHVLINAAGMSPYQEFRELDRRHLSQIIALNIQSLTMLCHLFLPHMLGHGEPSRVVNVGSVGAYAPLPHLAVYTGSKHYIRALSNSLSYEYRRTNIRVCALNPGGTLTEFPALAGQQIRKAAQKTMMTPEEVAEQAYPAILKGQRVIIPGAINQAAALAGKLLPFPWAMRLMDFIYNRSMDQVPPTYPL